jgi:tetratricopeptide (TPR) repeat protein
MSIESSLAGRMTIKENISSEEAFVPSLLPWVVAACGLVVYLVTLNHWVSLNSLLPVSKVSGWLWQPELTAPVYWLLTLPFHVLPKTLIPLALNLFSTFCAVLTLAQLARSVSLLPHDRTAQQRMREKSAYALLSIRTSWLPPVLAVIVCGLQLTFWENATVASGDMLDLLMFAYVVRCLLEFRVDGKDSWLFRAAVVYGAAMTNNWAMLAFFPVWLVALIWVRGVSFFDGRFLARMFLCGSAGLLFYLLLPLTISLSGQVNASVWQILKVNLATQKTYLSQLIFNKSSLFQGERPLWVLGLPSLLPVLAMAIRWPSYFGDISKLGMSLATWMFHVLHAAFLVVCFWVSLDPQFSPRNYQPAFSSYGILLLPFYFLGALSVGYYSGYFLLVFGEKPVGRSRFAPVSPPIVTNAVLACVWFLLIAAPVLLVWRNLPQIRITNGPMLRQYATLLAAKLPPKGAVVLSDDPARLMLLQSAIVQTGGSKDPLLLDTSSLKVPDYYKHLKKVYPDKWQISLSSEVKELGDSDVLFVLSKLAQTNTLFYLHPSFGYYFEVFYPEAHGLLYQLRQYSTNTPLLLLPTPESITDNETFWSQIDEPVLKPLLDAAMITRPDEREGVRHGLKEKLLGPKELNRDVAALTRFYSQSLDFWGVQMQRVGRLPEAAEHFQRAVDLYPDNVVAGVNLEFNKTLKTGHKTAVRVSKAVEDQFKKFRTWDAVMKENGPFDEPSLCYQQGRVFFEGGNYMQAAQEFLRVKELAPQTVAARLGLVEGYLLRHRLDDALAEIAEIRAQEPSLELTRTNQTELLVAETAAHLSKNDLPGGQASVNKALQRFPNDPDMLGAATKVFMNFQYYTNALEVIDQHLKVTPDDPTVLFNKGCACLQLKAYDQAIDSLTRIVDMGTNNSVELYELAVFVRARAYLGDNQLDKAQAGFEGLHKAHPAAFQPFYGLGEVAYARQDTNSAIHNYQLALAATPTNSIEANAISVRLKELRQGKF